MKRVAELPPKEYQILKLRQVEHKSNEEIAKLLGMEKPRWQLYYQGLE